MKIVAVLGSPRPQGNSNTLARAFLQAAGDRGAEVTEYLLNQMDFQGCQGCGGCKTKSQTCILEDDLTPVLQAVKEADLLVLASPVYFGDLSGQMKCFFDRTYSFFNPDFSCRMPIRAQVKPGFTVCPSGCFWDERVGEEGLSGRDPGGNASGTGDLCEPARCLLGGWLEGMRTLA